MCKKKLFKEQLKLVRVQKGFTQKQLADAVAINRSTIGHWETGIREPDIDYLCRLADVLDVSLDWLTGRSDK